MKVQSVLFNLFVVCIALFATFAAAHPHPKPSKTQVAPAPTPFPTCKAGPIQCCESVQPYKKISGMMNLFGFKNMGNIDVGMTCKPMNEKDLKAGKW